MMKAFLLAIFLHLIYFSLFSQEYSYTHYDIADGLAGSTVYCITQDKDWFIWVGTETGVSRFDGTHFKNFTTTDGLPDIEVVQMFGDSKGRVWMAPLKKSVCYYYKGRIYNQENDSLLQHIHLKGNVESFAEDDNGNILIQEREALHLVGADRSLSEYDSIGNEPLRECMAVSRNLAGHFQVQAGQKIFNLSEKGFSFAASIKIPVFIPNYIAMNPEWVVWRQDSDLSAIRSLINGVTVHRPFQRVLYNHITYSLVDDSLAFFNEVDGAKEYNTRTGQMRVFLPGREVSRTYRDVSGSLWFTTLGQGIYRLNSDEFRTIDVPTGDAAQTAVFSIGKIGNNIWLGNNHNHVYKLSSPDHAILTSPAFEVNAKNRILYFDEVNDMVFLASDVGVLEITKDLHGQRRGLIITGVKSVFKKNDKAYLISTSTGLAEFTLGCFCYTDTLWEGRSTAVYFHADTTYVGTLNGLYRIGPDKSVVFMGEKIPFLKKRISSIAASADHSLWIASYDDAGIIAIKNDSVVARITRQEGLTSDICRVLYIHDNTLWVGTDKGLNKVELDKPGYPVTRYTSNDGLGSDIVNAIYVDGPTIYVGTSSGMSFFNEAKLRPPEECRLQLLAVLNAGVDRIGDSARLLLSYKKSDIRFEFAGISYRSVGHISYHYRLVGLDDGWNTTKDSYLEYPALPSGKYEFQLQAINNFGIRSKLLSFPFEVATPFWHTFWFYGLLMACFLALVWMLFSMRIRVIRRRQEEKEQVSRRMTELEHKALQAQMNPHFIFNCLNSIQQYIFAQDIFAANKYITGFAKLIRATLNNSTRTFIPLSEEADYLSSYLSLEKLRFKDKMDYFIDVDSGIDRHSVLIPPMVIQPYVENSMRHGLRHKTEGKGYIRLTLTQTANQLVVIVEDNGIGREKAGQYKTGEHIEYQSKGMTLTADRIRMMNAGNKESITVEVIDLKDAQDRAAGTRVTITFPLFHTTPEKENP
jgi:ligand-binding sensor domain-containing protein